MAPRSPLGQMTEAKCPRMAPLEIKLFSRLGFWKTPKSETQHGKQRRHMSHTKACMSVSRWTLGSLRLQLSPLSSETTLSQGKPCLHVYLLEAERSKREMCRSKREMCKVLFLTSLRFKFTKVFKKSQGSLGAILR